MASLDFCCKRKYTFTERMEPDFRKQLAASANFRVAMSHLPDSHVAYVLACIGSDKDVTQHDIMGLRANLTANRWANAICQTCLKKKGAVQPCDKCFLWFYCDDVCQSKDARNHAAYCCNRNAPLDGDDPLKPAVIKTTAPTPAASTGTAGASRQQKRAHAANMAQYKSIVEDVARRLRTGGLAGVDPTEVARQLAAAIHKLNPSTTATDKTNTDKAIAAFLSALHTAYPEANPFGFVPQLAAAFSLPVSNAQAHVLRWVATVNSG